MAHQITDGRGAGFGSSVRQSSGPRSAPRPTRKNRFVPTTAACWSKICRSGAMSRSTRVPGPVPSLTQSSPSGFVKTPRSRNGTSAVGREFNWRTRTVPAAVPSVFQSCRQIRVPLGIGHRDLVTNRRTGSCTSRTRLRLASPILVEVFDLGCARFGAVAAPELDPLATKRSVPSLSIRSRGFEPWSRG